MTHTVIALATVVATATLTLACARTADYQEDFTQDVERICVDFCEQSLTCTEPPFFETYDECSDICLGTPYIYNDTDCGQAKRAMYECIGSTQTCELFNDTNNVHADEYTCQAEKEHYLGLDCGQSDEDPQGAP